jgi:oligopeptide/dipeptide ABC transporter ATP-binding protein
VLEVEGLHVWFDVPGGEVHAVRGVTFAVRRGEMFGLVGESGCGKSTTLYAVLGLLPPNASVAGRVRLHGSEILVGGEASIRAHRWNDIAMIFQGAMNAFNPVLTIGRQIREALEEHAVASGTRARVRAQELLALVQLPADTSDRYPHELSGGMRQRALIAMALSCDPKVILADEPTTALDVMIQAQILRLLEKAADELGVSVVLVTHDLALVAQNCRRAAVMYAGQIVEQGSLDELFHDAGHPYTRLLFAATPDLGAARIDNPAPGNPPRLDAPVVGCPFAPRCVHAYSLCLEMEPAMVELGAGHQAACHLNESSGRLVDVAE